MNNKPAILTAPEELFPAVPDWTRLQVVCPREDYCASRIARAVEDCDAHVLNLNVSSFGGKVFGSHAGTDGKSDVTFDIRIDRRDPERVCRSLERYGYTVVASAGSATAGADDSAAMENYRHLMRYLEI